MEKQRENSARVDAILIQLMKKHAPEIVEKLEAKDKEDARTAGASSTGGPAGDAPGPAAEGEANKRQKVA